MKNLIVMLGALALGALHLAPASAEPAQLRLCSAKPDGRYTAVASKLASEVRGQVDISVRTTEGSLDELRLVASGECDMAIVQSDATNVYDSNLDIQRVVPLYKEYVHLICNSESGISSVGDLRPSHKILVGTPGGGSAITWQNFGKEDGQYTKIGTEAVGGPVALTRVIGGRDAQCMLFVAGAGSPSMMKVNELGRGTLKLVAVDDWDFNDSKDRTGALVYDFADMPKNTYSNLQTGGWINATGPQTVRLDAVLVANTTWVEKNEEAYGVISAAAIRYSQQNN